MKRVWMAIVLGCWCSQLSAQVLTDSILLSKPDSGHVANLVGWISLRSEPEGAQVFHDSAFLGTTPLRRIPFPEGNTILRLFFPDARHWNALAGIDTVLVRDGQEVDSFVDLRVASTYGIRTPIAPETQTKPDLFLNTSEQSNPRLWMGYAAGATMILTGVLSAYLKTKSDNDFDSYVATNDPGLLSSTHRLDRLAGVSLFFSEFSLGVLMYLLLSE